MYQKKNDICGVTATGVVVVVVVVVVPDGLMGSPHYFPVVCPHTIFQ